MRTRGASPSPSHPPPRVRAAISLGALAVAASLAGCSADLESARGAESILDVIRVQGSIRPAELVRMATDPYDANNRYVGTFGLAGAYFAGHEAYLAIFEDNARDPDAGVRAAAVRGLANHGEPRHVPVLIAALTDADPQVRVEAARGLQRLHDASAVDPLIAAVREPSGPVAIQGEERDPAVRAEAATALGQYAQPRVVEALIAALRDESLAVNIAAAGSLRTLTGQDFGLDHAGWVEWRSAVGDPDALFRARGLYLYPVFRRSKHWWEYLPFMPPPPNEAPATPAGFPRTEP